MSAVTRALALRRLREESPVIALLRQDTMPVVAAELAEHLGGDERSLPAPLLYELIDDDLEELRRLGFDLPRSAQAYCTEWLHAGFLARHPVPGGKGETFSMTAAGHDAIRVLERLSQPLPAATDSRLSMISNEMVRLATDTDSSIASRVAALEAERDRVEEEIEAALEGRIREVDADAALVRLRDLLQQARDVPADFARVRDSLEELNRRLRHDIIEDSSPQGDILDEIFTGVDRIRDSPEGRSFGAFYELVMDREAGERFTEAVEKVLDRDFAASLPDGTRAFLRGYLTNLQHESIDVSRTMGTFSRSLRQFVQSRQFEAYRELADRLRRAQRAGIEAASHLRLFDRMEARLELTSPRLRSVGRLALHVPSEVQAPAEVVSHDLDDVSWEDLRRRVRESEIDLEEIQGWIRESVGALGECSVSRVLDRHPATQGLASVVGLCVLGARHGSAVPEAESLSWSSGDRLVHATLSTTFVFKEVPDDWA